MKPTMTNSIIPIAAIFSFRMLGLFMLIPVFTLYAPQLMGATPTLIGLALGCYGLSQGLLQIPFGILSDRFGRKTMISVGLILFALGSLIGATTHSIYGMLIARLIQGMGAIGSVLIALMADLTHEKQRTGAMAVIGASIGISFSLAILISPVLCAHFGLSSIFYLTALLAVCGLLILHAIIPSAKKQNELVKKTTRVLFLNTLKNPQLQRLNAGIFCQHFILTASFFVIPKLLQAQMLTGHLSAAWHFYLPILLGSFFLMIPMMIWAERTKSVALVFQLAVGVTSICQIILGFVYPSYFCLSSTIFTYFVMFNLLEAHLPSLTSKQTDIDSRGCAMGIYSSCQFLGIFAGGSLSGLFYNYIGTSGIFFMNAGVALMWLVLITQNKSHQLLNHSPVDLAMN